MTIATLLHALWCLVSSWWNVDRIRIPRSEGRLLRLAEGDRLLVQDELLVIRHRQSGQQCDCIRVLYALSESTTDDHQAAGDLWYLEQQARPAELLRGVDPPWVLIDPKGMKSILPAEAITVLEVES